VKKVEGCTSVGCPSGGVILRVITGEAFSCETSIYLTFLTSARLFQNRFGGHLWSTIDGSAVHLAYDDREFPVDRKYSLDFELVLMAIDMILVFAHEETCRI